MDRRHGKRPLPFDDHVAEEKKEDHMSSSSICQSPRQSQSVLAYGIGATAYRLAHVQGNAESGLIQHDLSHLTQDQGKLILAKLQLPMIQQLLSSRATKLSSISPNEFKESLLAT